MSYSGEAAEQVVRMSLNGVEVAAKLSGKAAERLAVLLYAVLKEQKKSKGKIRLTNMLKSGKELKVFAIKDTELQKFCEEAKKYGVLYCVLKDRDAGDGLTDIMTRAEDASKINRIFERFGLASIDMGTVKTEIEKSRTKDGKVVDEDIPVPERNDQVKDKVDEFLDAVVPQQNPTAETMQTQNPTMARTAKSRPSEPSYETRAKSGVGTPDKTSERERPSVRQELQDIRRDQGHKPEKSGRSKTPDLPKEHIHTPKKKSAKEVR